MKKDHNSRVAIEGVWSWERQESQHCQIDADQARTSIKRETGDMGGAWIASSARCSPMNRVLCQRGGRATLNSPEESLTPSEQSPYQQNEAHGSREPPEAPSHLWLILNELIVHQTLAPCFPPSLYSNTLEELELRRESRGVLNWTWDEPFWKTKELRNVPNASFRAWKGV